MRIDYQSAIAVLADDLTSAADGAAPFVARGLTASIGRGQLPRQAAAVVAVDSGSRSATSSQSSEAVLLDRFDFKILVRLQREGRCSNVDLADSVGLSPGPCLLRTRRLQEIGLIRGYGADIALDKLGDYVTVFSEITLSSHRPHDFRKFEVGAGKYEEIVDCYNVSGGNEYLLKIVVPGINYFQALMEKMLKDDIGIERIASRIVLRQPLNRREYPLGIVATRKR